MPVRIFIAIAAGVVTSCASANVLFNGAFELQPNFGSGIGGNAGFSLLTGSQIPGWTITAGHGATVHNTLLYPTISGNYSVNMDAEGYNGVNASIYQDFASINGGAGILEFDWQGWQANPQPRLHVSLVDTTTQAIVLEQSYAFDAALHHEILTFVGTGNTLRLLVQESPQSGGNDNCFMVDNFSVIVPVPSTGLLLGLGGLVVARRKR